jgi:hypothetical protein
MSEQRVPSKGGGNAVGEVIDLVKGYARQETLGPLRNAGRWIGFGVAGAFFLGLGGSLVLLGLLRLLQGTRTDPMFGGRLTFLPYLITLVACAAGVGLAVLGVRKSTLARKENPR